MANTDTDIEILNHGTIPSIVFKWSILHCISWICKLGLEKTSMKVENSQTEMMKQIPGRKHQWWNYWKNTLIQHTFASDTCILCQIHVQSCLACHSIRCRFIKDVVATQQLDRTSIFLPNLMDLLLTTWRGKGYKWVMSGRNQNKWWDMV